MANGAFLGLNTALQGLMATQAAIDTASHNIDNANTPGYAREQVNLTETPALTEWGLSSQGPGQIGTGVEVAGITRLSSPFMNSEYRDQNQALGQSQVHQDTLNQITGIINEPSDTGISNALQQFWSAWDTLQSNPSDLSARTQVQQTGVTLAQTLNQTANQLTSLHTNEQDSLQSRVTQANSLISQIGSLSKQIEQQQATANTASQTTTSTDTPNDLLNKRDSLLDQLSQLGKVDVVPPSVTTNPTTGATVTTPYEVKLGGQVVVSNGHTGTLSVSASGGIQTSTYDTASQSFSSSANTAIANPGGELQGTIDSIGYVQSYQTDLNNIAQALAGTNGQGKMTITLGSSWTLTSTSGTPSFPVSGTLPNGTTTFKAGDSADPTNFPGDGLTKTTQSGVTTVTIPAGTTVTVYGINGLEQLGYSQDGPGQAFFTSSQTGQALDATNISVQLTPAQIAAGTNAQAGTQVAISGDGTLAGTISGVKTTQTTFPNPADPTKQMKGTVSDYLQSVVSEVGIQSQTANNDVTNGQALVQQASNQRQSVSGVSLDQEMTNVIEYQQAYNASAKMVSTINQMLQTLMTNV